MAWRFFGARASLTSRQMHAIRKSSFRLYTVSTAPVALIDEICTSFSVARRHNPTLSLLQPHAFQSLSCFSDYSIIISISIRGRHPALCCLRNLQINVFLPSQATAPICFARVAAQNGTHTNSQSKASRATLGPSSHSLQHEPLPHPHPHPQTHARTQGLSPAIPLLARWCKCHHQQLQVSGYCSIGMHRIASLKTSSQESPDEEIR